MSGAADAITSRSRGSRQPARRGPGETGSSLTAGSADIAGRLGRLGIKVDAAEAAEISRLYTRLESHIRRLRAMRSTRS